MAKHNHAHNTPQKHTQGKVGKIEEYLQQFRKMIEFFEDHQEWDYLV